MKKLTKTLSLVLVIAMIVSLCVVGVSAKTFSKDGAKINENYKEAVDVMSGIGIIEGTDTAGTTFNPTGNFTRAAAAKIIAYMQLGVDAASALKGTASTFKDVPSTNWAAPYIAYCAQQGIIAGYGNGNFGPDDALTGYAWAKMLLCAVGYGVKNEYTGASWSINVAKDALTKGVFDNVLSASTPEVITREQATQMAFNTLTGVAKVTYSTLAGDYIDASTSISGVSTNNYTLGLAVYKLHNTINPATSTNPANTIATKYDAQTTATVKGAVYAAVDGVVCKTGDTLNTGRYAYVWYTQASSTADKVQVSSIYYVDSVLGTANNGKGLTAWGTKSTTNPYFVCQLDSNPTYYYNGAVDASGTNCTTASSKLGVTFTFVDTDENGKANTVYCVEKTTDVLKAAPYTFTGTDTNSYVYIDMTASDIGASKTASTVLAAQVLGTEGLAKDDVVLYYQNLANGTYNFEKAKAFTGTLKSANTVDNKYVVDTTTYSLSGQAMTGFNSVAFAALSAGSAAYFTDDAGYVVLGKLVDTTPTDMLYVLDVAGFTGGVFANDRFVKAMMMDGTIKTVAVAKVGTSTTDKPADATLYYYTVNAAGAYELTAVPAVSVGTKGYAAASGAVITGVPAAAGVTTDSTTKFIYRDKNSSGTMLDTATVYTGIASAKAVSASGGEAYIGANGIAQYVFLENWTAASATSDDYIYLLGDTFTTVYKADGSVDYYTLPAIVNGKVDVVKTASNVLTAYNSTSNTTGLGKGGAVVKDAMYTVTYTDGALAANSMTLVNQTASAASYYWGKLTGTAAATGDTVKLGSTTFTYTSTCAVYFINSTTQAVTTGAVTDINEDANDEVFAVATGKTADTAANYQLSAIYVLVK